MTCAHTCTSYTGVVSCPATWPRVCTGCVYPVCEGTACRRCCRCLEAEGEMERTYRLKQKDLVKEVDVTSASKVGRAGGGNLVGYTTLGIFVALPYSLGPLSSLS